MTGTEMSAFEAQINFTLLNDIIGAVIKTADAAYQRIEALLQRCIFPIHAEGIKNLQEKYGFMYFGELLERYEERYGMSLKDQRAIALALGYTRDIATDAMFVGSQRDNFVRAVKKCAQGDIYLTGALYLLHENGSDGTVYEQMLIGAHYSKTEELIFAMSLFGDTEQALSRFKSQLPRLLGPDRTLPVFENTQIFGWLAAAMSPHKKELKGKGADVLRALLALPTSFAKKGSKSYDCLLANGYTLLELTYANAMAVYTRWLPSGLKSSGLTAEKIVVELFRVVLSQEEAPPPGVFDQLTELYQAYKNFDVKCYEERRLSEVLKLDVHINNAEVMAWFIDVESIHHPAVNSFDVLDPKWDSLAVTLKRGFYLRLFEMSLTQEMSAAELRDRIARYNMLTQTDYLDSFRHTEGNLCFYLLVRAGVIDLWTAFQESIGPDDVVSSPEMLRYISRNIEGVRTPQAFLFLKKFMPQYGYDGLATYFCGSSDGFDRHLWIEYNYPCRVSLSLNREFLQDAPENQLLLLHWAEEYFYSVKPSHYLAFVHAVLKDDWVASLLPFEDRRRLFDLYVPQSELAGYEVSNLKQLYLAPDELKADQEAKETAKQMQEQKEAEAQAEKIRQEYKEIKKPSFESIMKFVDKHIRHSEDMLTVSLVVREDLGKRLEKADYALTKADFTYFLQACGVLLDYSAMSWTEAQNYFMKIKEVIEDAPSDDQTA